MADELAEFDDERTLTRDLLWYCDMTTGPDGRDLDFDDRMAEVRERYGPDHYAVVLLLPLIYGPYDGQRREGLVLRRQRAGRRHIPLVAAPQFPGPFPAGYESPRRERTDYPL